MNKTDLGYYTVNGVSFNTNKVAAILEAQRVGADIEWHFHDTVFNSVDWTKEPEPSLDMMYEARARQIREKYDYVIVFCSGGADSTNVIRTFMNNNIHVDEVVAMIPESGLNNYDSNDTDRSPTNLMSETKYAQYPILHEVSTRSPRTKITVIDIFKNVEAAESDAWIFESEGDMIDLVSYSYGKLDSVPHLVDMAERGVSIAAVWGTDKPIITFLGDTVATLLADGPIYLPKYPFKTAYPNVDRVLFYWSHDMPELMIKQAHVVARELLKPENKAVYQACIDMTNIVKRPQVVHSADEIILNMHKPKFNPAGYYSPKTIFQRGIVPFVYPTTWDNKVFQVNKFDLTQTFLPAFASWVSELHLGSRVTQLIESDFKSFYSQLSPKYLNPNKSGFRMCVKIFPIGNRSNFIKKP